MSNSFRDWRIALEFSTEIIHDVQDVGYTHRIL